MKPASSRTPSPAPRSWPDSKEDDYRVIEYDPPATLSSVMGFAEMRSGADWTSILDFTAPRAWYLSTTLPALIETQPKYGGEP
jgi:hypothetical protein